jgi:hypothetical protein
MPRGWSGKEVERLKAKVEGWTLGTEERSEIRSRRMGRAASYVSSDPFLSTPEERHAAGRNIKAMA